MEERVKKQADFVRCCLLEEIKKSEARGRMFVTTNFHTDDADAAARVLTYALDRLMPCETEENAAAKPDDTENRSPYAATVDGMLSPDYKERFKAEYQQTKIRYEKLKAFNNRIEAAYRSENVDMPPQDCPPALLREQQAAMGKYLHILEVRAVIAGIDL